MNAILPFKLILGSASFSRRKILEEMGYEFKIATADIDEKSIREEKPEDLVMTLAEAKADAIIANLQNTTVNNQPETDEEPTILVAADTVHWVEAGAICLRIQRNCKLLDTALGFAVNGR
ncbi:unnamed protein product [Dovyalis caffra]|uniref:Maf-like protein n=1 Tax=Dovyalis caffra TaxID=77055 RepID=A0AAV1SE69_9ROSI|nr:unnamed protein product [Dovyalis caffra]